MQTRRLYRATGYSATACLSTSRRGLTSWIGMADYLKESYNEKESGGGI